jgi:hypothetical protein
VTDYGTGPASPPNRAPRTRPAFVIAQAAAVVFVVLCVCCGCVGKAFLNGSDIKPERSADTTVVEFVRDLRSGKVEHAYAELCDDTRERWSRYEFADNVNARPRISDVEIIGGSESSLPWKASATVFARLVYESGAKERHDFPLIMSGTDWKICGDPF